MRAFVFAISLMATLISTRAQAIESKADMEFANKLCWQVLYGGLAGAKEYPSKKLAAMQMKEFDCGRHFAPYEQKNRKQVMMQICNAKYPLIDGKTGKEITGPSTPSHRFDCLVHGIGLSTEYTVKGSPSEKMYPKDASWNNAGPNCRTAYAKADAQYNCLYKFLKDEKISGLAPFVPPTGGDSKWNNHPESDGRSSVL
jgi:hypothetical protein